MKGIVITTKYEMRVQEFSELCVSCAHKLKLWLNGDKEENDE